MESSPVRVKLKRFVANSMTESKLPSREFGQVGQNRVIKSDS